MTLSQRPIACLRRQLVILIGAGLVLATLFNGVASYLKRIGAVDHASYQAFWLAHCGGKQFLAEPLPPWTITAFCPCIEGRRTIDNAPDQVLSDRAQSRYLYSSTGFEIVLKLLKDVLAVACVLLSIHLMWNRRVELPALHACWPLLFMVAIMVVGFANAWINHGSVLALAGLRPYLFLAIALACGWVAPDIGVLARCVAILLTLELATIPLEYAYGIHLHGHFGDTAMVGRLSGTLVAPNTFGIFAVAGLAFYHAYSHDRRYIAPLSFIGLALVTASGSATALLVLFLFAFVIAIANLKGRRLVAVCIAGAALAAVLLTALPTLVGRADVFESVFGAGARWDEITTTLRSADWPELMAGSGLGLGTNTAVNMREIGESVFLGASLVSPPVSAESGLITLLRQSGLVGLLAFYSTLAWASFRNFRAAPFYLVIAVCSLTAKVTELFPVNLLLGLALAHSFSTATEPPRPHTAGNDTTEHRG